RGGGDLDRAPGGEGARARRLVRGGPAASRRPRGARPRTVSPRDLRGVVGGEGAGARPASRLLAGHRAALPVAARGRGPARRLSTLPGHHQGALPGSRRPVDGGPPRTRSAVVRAGDGEGPRAGVRALVPPRGRSRRHLRPRRALRALPAALSSAPARLVPRSGRAGGARREGAPPMSAPAGLVDGPPGSSPSLWRRQTPRRDWRGRGLELTDP